MQDEIPNYDDDDEDEIISDIHDNYDKTITKSNKVASPMGSGTTENGRNRI